MKIGARYKDPRNFLLWISLAILIRGCILSFFIHESHQLTPERIVGGIAVKQNDYYMFFGPVEEYFKSGSFSLDGIKPFAGRIPGYSTPYFILRMAFSEPTAVAILIIFQFLLSAVCVYLLSLMALRQFRHARYFYLTFFISAVSMYTALYDIFTLAESFSVSAITLCLYFVFRFLDTEKKRFLVFAGIFLGWAVFLRLFLGILIVLVPLLLFIYLWKKNNFKKAFWYVFLFLLPFCIFESAWVTRNFISLKKFVPLETSLDESYGNRGSYRSSALAVRRLIIAWGGEPGEFYDHSEGWWFREAEGKDADEYVFQPGVFRGNFTKDSLVYLKMLFNESISKERTASEQDSLNLLAEKTADRFREGYVTKNFMSVYLLNPLKRARRLVFSNPGLAMPLPRYAEMSIFEKGIKFFYTALYFLIISGACGAVLLMLLKRKFTFEWLLLLTFPAAIILTLTFFPLSIMENRYFLSAYPICILFVMYLLSLRYEKNQ
ncbi:MAG: hypothetical protein ACJ77K_07310 [Bacteroidia bacterium]